MPQIQNAAFIKFFKEALDIFGHFRMLYFL